MKIITFLMPLIILMSGSRASIIGLLIILVIYLLYKKNIKLLLLSILIITGVNMSEHILDEELYYKYEEILSLINIFDDIKNSSGSENSLGVRSGLISNGIEALIDSYGLGVGAGNSLEVQRQVGGNILSMHNIWIELLVEGGILFFVFL
ncbi:O-antigen ligase family protein [Planococcus koreensis]|uniref:O-antigen ligase family protein n=1 Tax=Planococcus koreensis TaxID=112331 RepID=UPI0039FCA37E